MADVLPIAERWFVRQRVDDALTLLREPHVMPLMRCNIWHLRGADRDLLVDSGMGLVSLASELADLAVKTVTGWRPMATTTTSAGSTSSTTCAFTQTKHAPARSAARLARAESRWGDEAVEALETAGYAMSDRYFVTALPPGFAIDSYHQDPVPAVHHIVEGDVVDLGDRQFEVLHLPGHSPGSIGLWEEHTGTLFSGDAIYDGPLLDELAESSIRDYCTTMERLLALPVTVVHGGHDESFGRARLHEIARAYLARRSG